MGGRVHQTACYLGGVIWAASVQGSRPTPAPGLWSHCPPGAGLRPHWGFCTPCPLKAPKLVMMDIHVPQAHRTGFLNSPYQRLPWTGGASHPSPASVSLLHWAVCLLPCGLLIFLSQGVRLCSHGLLVLSLASVLCSPGWGVRAPGGGWPLGHYCCPQPPPRFPEGPAGGGSSSSSCEEPQWSGGPPAVVHGRSTSEAGPGSAPRGHHSSWRPVLLRQVLGTYISEAPIFSVLVSGVGRLTPGFRGSGPQPTP